MHELLSIVPLRSSDAVESQFFSSIDFFLPFPRIFFPWLQFPLSTKKSLNHNEKYVFAWSGTSKFVKFLWLLSFLQSQTWIKHKTFVIHVAQALEMKTKHFRYNLRHEIKYFKNEGKDDMREENNENFTPNTFIIFKYIIFLLLVTLATLLDFSVYYSSYDLQAQTQSDVVFVKRQ